MTITEIFIPQREITVVVSNDLTKTVSIWDTWRKLNQKRLKIAFQPMDETCRNSCEVYNRRFQTQQRVNSQRDCNLFKSNVAIKRFIAALVSGAQSWTLLNAA